jgi:hypothetical protein
MKQRESSKMVVVVVQQLCTRTEEPLGRSLLLLRSASKSLGERKNHSRPFHHSSLMVPPVMVVLVPLALTLLTMEFYQM